MGMADVLRSLGAEEPLGPERPLETSEEWNEQLRSPTRAAGDGWRANGAAPVSSDSRRRSTVFIPLLRCLEWLLSPKWLFSPKRAENVDHSHGLPQHLLDLLRCSTLKPLCDADSE